MRMPSLGPRTGFPPIVIAAPVYVATIALLIMVAADKPWQRFVTVLSTPLSAAWCAVVAGQVSIWMVLLGPIRRRFARYHEIFREYRIEAVGVVLAMLLLFLLLTVGNRLDPSKVKFPVNSQKTKVAFVTACGFAVAFPCLFGMRLASVAAARLAGLTDGLECHLEAFRSHLQDLDWFLSVAGIIVAGATLSTGILRSALKSLNAKEMVEPVTVLLYGAICSALIAAIYLPAFAAAANAGQRIVESLLPFRDVGGANEWIEISERRTKLAALLGINATGWQRLSGGLAVIAPLASSALSFVVSR